MPVPQIDSQELLDLIGDHGVKDLDNFRVKSKLLKLSKKYEQLLSKEPVVAYTYLGILEAYKNNYDSSIDLLKKALKLSPLEPVVLQNLGKSYEQKGAYKEAFNSYLATLRITPSDKDVYENTFLLAEFFCDVAVLDELKEINSNLFSSDRRDSIYALYEFLTARDFDFDNYRTQLACAYKTICRYVNFHRLAIQRYYNHDGAYLSNVIEVDYMDIEHLTHIGLEYEEELLKTASLEADGGFDFYNKLSQSCVVFTFLNSERQIA